ncbi:MAG: hypothetical protein CML50_01980 [Rhodobacteraceae bacterium]|jgi:hypothetical protein|uniref:Uncharacterized protein n=1 Tax=Salipiger profundus TaxID=1229727 RepID=A0A1U7D4M2_9RHOB|nr:MULTISPECIES: hypothetical protein [Salipiger]APX23114.1 hypothetical protein Ga0080559_TMP2318 [Salipiger profundus]MAB04773.1 hypothetical protein [Paracoccaceae bacterium]GGA13424.1 hypothetical protein GCM10011326_26790 [Salipiger profundus]SFD18807.1 hypothetical protein SAMN05444415_108108 [Salipiger profundus]
MTIRSTKLGLAALLAATVSSGAVLAQSADDSTSMTADPMAQSESQVETGTTMEKSDSTMGSGTTMESETTMQSGSGMEAETAMETETGEAPETMGEFMADLNGDGIAMPMGDISEDAEVTTKTLGDLEGEGAENSASIDNALAKAQTQLDMLQTRIDGSETLSSALEEEGYTSDDVLGVYQTAEGSVTILIDDRA